MTISVGGSYNSWVEKKQYSVSVWDASEVFINALIETLEKRVERALKDKDYAKVTEIAKAIDELTKCYAEAIENAKTEEAEYLRKQAEQES